MTCLSACYGLILFVGGVIATAIAESRATRVLLALALLASASPVMAQRALPDPIPTGGMFTVQCDAIYYAVMDDGDDTTALDVRALMAMAYEPGVWQGYDSPLPFGGREQVVMVGHIWTVTTCGADGYARVYENSDGSYTLMVYWDTVATYADTDEPCVYQPGQDNPRHCGLHHGVFGFVSAEEWARVSGEQQVVKRK